MCYNYNNVCNHFVITNGFDYKSEKISTVII